MGVKYMKYDLTIFGIQFRGVIRKALTPVYPVGTYSLCEDGKHVVFIDYDNLPINIINAELLSLQKDFNLGTFYLFETSKGNYFALCLDKVSIGEYESILQWANCDANFRHGYKYNSMNSFVMRLTPKKEKSDIRLKQIIPFISLREKSNAHRLLLQYHFDIKIRKESNFDNFTTVMLCNYKTYR